jgi:superfamily II DNA or RNA helicase
MEQAEFSNTFGDAPGSASAGPLRLLVTLDAGQGCFHFAWLRSGAQEPLARGQLFPTPEPAFPHFMLEWELEIEDRMERDGCGSRGSSVRALVSRLRKRLPVADDCVEVRLLADSAIGPVKAGRVYKLVLPPAEPAWKWLAREVQRFATLLEGAGTSRDHSAPEMRGQAAALALAHFWLSAPPNSTPGGSSQALFPPTQKSGLQVCITLDIAQGFIQLDWSDPESRQPKAVGWIRCTESDELTWSLEAAGRRESTTSSHHLNSIRGALFRWAARFPANPDLVSVFSVRRQPHGGPPLRHQEHPLDPGELPWDWLCDNVKSMAGVLRANFAPLAKAIKDVDPLLLAEMERDQRRFLRKERKREEELARRRQNMERLAEERRLREQHAAEANKAAEAKKAAKTKAEHASPVAQPRLAERLPLPPVLTHIEIQGIEFQETAFPLTDLRPYYLRERAALWWISNQSDDLLCLPHCRLERLEYQLRTALRVLGPLRGRALLSDEVGLGKTIEAGLVLKELLTRGMVKRFLVLTVPSLVDQWEEELNDKFGLTTATTNHAAARGDPQKFWRENPGLVASLHTLKQPAQLEIARQVHWDILIVDEAHYLRNRESQAWQAVNALPRQFLLLLTATPVQNSLEELYNLVTLLQPGQLPTPKEFRGRFIDPKRPRQPREPEELRRLLGQVMIRNTRANAGIQLPPRRAETVLFEPAEAERAFWQQWETEFRACLAQFNPSQASLWGRLLLQTAGSSPAAWREALHKFPDRAAARAWSEQAPLEASWQRKCDLLSPLTRGEGGAVIFTQFLQTQAALAEHLRRVGVATFVINGATPPPERQPITEEFHAQGGALLLTHSGTEGRNLQFSHRLANFDLPWNPMEIEQRIGRLHRLGQRHPVRIYNFVQAGTLQEHLLQILQEKLNLFELVVGETGLILGERFTSDEFAEEVLRRWRDSEGRVAEALAGLGDELAAARDAYGEVKKLDETLFEKDYESL